MNSISTASKTSIIQLLLLFCAYCCCSFVAVPVSQKAPPQQKRTANIKKEQRQQRRLLRLQKRQAKRHQLAKKNHKTLNIVGFFMIIGAVLLLVLGVAVLLLTIGFSTAINVPLYALVAFCSVVAFAGGVLCLLGVIGAKEVPNSKMGFGIAGLCIIAIPLLVATVALFVAFFRAVGILA